METSKLKKFAQFARRSLIEQVSNKLKLALAEKSAARRESTEAIEKLEMAIRSHGKDQVIGRVAYIWFNRFCALRFMDVNRYTRIGVVSPAEGQFQPEILAEAKMGHIDEEMVHEKIRQQIFALLDGKAPSHDPQGEAYRLLVVAACNSWNKAMPFLFERIDDYTELLMPDDLLSGNSILAYTREAMTPDACKDVEVIGWLYQFYISEKKDEVFEGLKKNKKITPENIPAATQLFTPHWIVRYLVENSLGRLWMLNRPSSKLVEQMDYYIKPEQVETEFLRIGNPEEIKICDPACGSGHMLTYAFELLYAIYEEEGYEPLDIPVKILTHNLYGVEIDERAGELAAFALTMKARGRQRRFFSRGIKPNICVLENVHFDEDELKEYMNFIGRDLFTAPLQTTLRQFEEADNFGSLIRPDVTDVAEMLEILEAKNVSGHLFLNVNHQKVLQALRQADYLSPKYHVVIANPPYMGSRGMNRRLTAWAKDNYPLGNADAYSMFMERSFELVFKAGYVGMINLPSWLFLSAFQQIRQHITAHYFVSSMLHMGRGIFGIDWGSTAFVIQTNKPEERLGCFYRLHQRVFQYIHFEDIKRIFLKAKENPNLKFNFEGYGEEKNSSSLETLFTPDGKRIFFVASSESFARIPGAPFAYWFGEAGFSVFTNALLLADVADVKTGMSTSDNDRFVRYWTEVSFANIGFQMASREEAKSSEKTWFPYNKGGGYRKWYGYVENVVNWRNDGEGIKSNVDENGKRKASVRAEDYYFREAISYSAVSSKRFSARHSDHGFLFDSGGSSVFPKPGTRHLLAILCSKIPDYFLAAYNDTINFQPGDVARIPISTLDNAAGELLEPIVGRCIQMARQDWDSFEWSWNFQTFPLLRLKESDLKIAFHNFKQRNESDIQEVAKLESKVNKLLIDSYGLTDQLPYKVDVSDVTLDKNSVFRYSDEKDQTVLETLFLADTMREFICYSVGCMFGRYALDKPGLVLATQGENIEDYLKKIPNPRFRADDDNVIPMLDGDWFTDDIAERFREFLREAFGEEHYEENLQFVEQALNIKGKRNYGIRDYFLSEFYNDHVKRYKKRPIYWLFSSPKGSFNALIYMHRYRPDTVSVVLNDYLREFRTKLTARKNHLEAVSISASASQSEKTKALKEIEKLHRMIAEMEEYERDVLYPLATEQVEIDLDDGVKANYPKFGAALKKITGLS